MTSSLLIYGKLNDFLPDYGLAWTEDSQKVFIAQIKDGRNSSLLKTFLSQFPSPTNVIFTTSSKTLAAELSNLYHQLKTPDDIVFDSNLKASEQMLPSIAVDAGKMLVSLTMGSFAEVETYKFVHQLTSQRTTVSDFVLSVLGVAGDDNNDLTHILNKPSSAMGRRRIKDRFFSHPFTDALPIKSRQRLMHVFLTNRHLTNKLKSYCLSHFEDLDKLTCKLNTYRKLTPLAVKKFASTSTLR